MKFRGKILLAFLLAGLPLVAFEIVSVIGEYRAERGRALDRLRGDAEVAARIVQVFLRDLAARGEQTARHVPRAGDRQAYLGGRLADLRRWNAGITGVAWLDGDGRVVAGEPRGLFRLGTSMADRAGFQSLRGGQAWALDELVIDERAGHSLPVFRMMARDANGAFRGVAVIALKPDLFGPLFPSGTQWATIRLADRGGRLVYGADRPDPTLDEREHWAEMQGVRQALQGNPAFEPEVSLAGAGQGRVWMAAHVRIPPIGWVASALIPAAEAMRPARAILSKGVAAHAVLLVLCVAAALVVAGHVAKPARRLAETARRIAGGERTARVRPVGRDELAAVGRAFDEMAEALESSWRAVTAQRDAAENMAGRLATLGQLSGLVGSTLDTRRVFDFVAEATSRLLGEAAALVLVADETGERLTISASYGIARPELRLQDGLRAGEGLAGWVFQRREPLVVRDMLADSRALNRGWIEAEGLRAFAGVPLMVRDRCLGVLCAMSGGRQAFGGADVDLLAAFATPAATAMENARHYELVGLEQERLRAILEAMPEAVMVVEGKAGERDMRLVMANRARLELLGTPALVPGAHTPYYELTRADGAPLDDAELPLQRALWQGESTRSVELAVRFPDGSQRYILANAAPLPDVSGTRRGVVVLQDITQRKLGEEALRASEERFRRVADSNMIGIAFWDMGGRLKDANRAFLDLIGYSPADLLSGRLNWQEITPAEHAQLDQRALREIQQTGICAPYEKEYIRKDGRRIPVLLGAALLEGSQNEGVAFALDLTERKRVEDELKRLAEEVVALYERAAREARVKGLLLDELNHRVRNNLALIVSFMELQQVSLEGRAAAAVLEDAIARVEGLGLVYNALAGVGYEAAEYAPLAHALAEHALAEGALAGRVAFRVQGVPLRLPSAQLTALGLITNELFTNIAKHAYPGGRTGKVEVTVELADGEAVVCVRDDGVGLPAGFGERPGHLGLQLIRSLAEASLKGTFALESGGGTIAIVRFPSPDGPAQGA